MYDKRQGKYSLEVKKRVLSQCRNSAVTILDMRLSVSKKASAQRSVNLAVSSRGLAALYSIEPALMNKILENAIPMKGRLLHLAFGKTESQPYDSSGQVRILKKMPFFITKF